MKKLTKTTLYGILGALALALAIPGISFATEKKVVGSISIPSLNAKGTIVEMPTITGLGADLWHRGPGTPGDPTYQNVVLAGHRTSFGSKRVPFNNLPLMKIGDEVNIIWEGKNYTYKVTGTEIVTPSNIAIEFNTNKPTLTMYTCVYSFNAKNRYVVTAELVETN